MTKPQSSTTLLHKIGLGGISVLIADFILSGVLIDTWITGFLLAAVIILINFTLNLKYALENLLRPQIAS